jgi:hypothetical protein
VHGKRGGEEPKMGVSDGHALNRTHGCCGLPVKRPKL